MGVFTLKSRRWGQTSSVLGGPYGVGSKGSLWVPMSPGSAEATVPGPSPLGTRSAWRHTSCGLVWPTVLLVVWVFHDRGCGVGGTILSSLHWLGSSSASPVPFPFVSSITVYSLGPLPIFTVAPPAPPPYPGALGEALTGGVPGSLTLFLNCGQSQRIIELAIPVVHLVIFKGRCWLPGSDILHHLHGSLSFLSLPVLRCESATDRGTRLSTQQMLIFLSGTVVGDPFGLLLQ